MYIHPIVIALESEQRQKELAHMAAAWHVGSNTHPSSRLGDIWRALLHRPAPQPRAAAQPRIGGARPA